MPFLMIMPSNTGVTETVDAPTSTHSAECLPAANLDNHQSLFESSCGPLAPTPPIRQIYPSRMLVCPSPPSQPRQSSLAILSDSSQAR